MNNNEILSTCYTKTVEAYMGGQGYEGSNSHCYSGDAIKQMREIAKACKIKGVTFSRHSYSGGSSISIKMKLLTGDVRDYDEIAEQVENVDFLNIGHRHWMSDPSIDRPNCSYLVDNFWKETAERQKELLHHWGLEWYNMMVSGNGSSIMHYWQLDQKNNPCFTEQFFDRWNALGKIVSSFNYDHSNAMVDYFDVNFYEHWYIINKFNA